MRHCDTETAEYMGKALLKHAREVHHYALAYCAPTEDNEYIDTGSRVKYTENLERMLKELYALMLMAKYKGVSRFTNREQIEAYMEAASELLAPAQTAADSQFAMN
jgi:hypothetical protein